MSVVIGVCRDGSVVVAVVMYFHCVSRWDLHLTHTAQTIDQKGKQLHRKRVSLDNSIGPRHCAHEEKFEDVR
jgi:hypothetical protein